MFYVDVIFHFKLDFLTICRVKEKTKQNSQITPLPIRRLHGVLIGRADAVGLRGSGGVRACPVALLLRPQQQEDGVGVFSRDAVEFVVAAGPPAAAGPRQRPLLPHRGDGEEVFHRGDPGRDHDHR